MGARHTSEHRRIVIAAGIAVALVALSSFMPVAEWAESLENSLVSRNLLAAIALFTAVYAVATLLFVPA